MNKSIFLGKWTEEEITYRMSLSPKYVNKMLGIDFDESKITTGLKYKCPFCESENVCMSHHYKDSFCRDCEKEWLWCSKEDEEKLEKIPEYYKKLI